MTKQPEDTGKLTNMNNGSEKDTHTSQSVQHSDQAVTHEQVSDTLAEGTIDYAIEQQNKK
ncbi:DUF4025 domain-containing protein [Microbacteriaceae bacterium 4G12]